ncbi:hypothetical protein [Raineya orbicola]|jgi:hypothetical protein|uniref:Lipoprotein n=1 Tax=Raineya orbicola TaxID=2016530 RepID=A0A2N3IIV2_9BACT|nr:hypothetical protein [Raineya orbicola]PKQ70237.1 hypothetical protein Rain11_0758 [Raineya orbicola]
MKKLKFFFAFTALVALLATSACTRRYTCPTYLKQEPKTEKQDIRG